MTEATHTPGPWRIDTQYDPAGPCIMAGDRYICGNIDNDPDDTSIEFDVQHGLSAHEVFGLHAENLANARLMCAAPDLREAVRELLPIIEAVRYTAGLGKTQIARVERAKAALAACSASARPDGGTVE